MADCLYDEKGYEIKLEISKTYIPAQNENSADTRELGALLCYLGADKPDVQETYYKKDPYVLSRLEFPYVGQWNYHALKELYGPEENGTWMASGNIVYLRDTGIRKSGLRITYYVPAFLVGLNSVMSITVCGDLVREIPLAQEGMFTEVIDVSEVGKEEREYLENAQRILKILLSEFDRVCQKYKLQYYLICGSLLGAVRHKDLIPWDDDVDIAMPRKDFDILLQHVDEEWGTKDEYMFLNYNKMGNHTFLDYMTRLVYMKEEIPVNVFRKIKGKGRTDIENHMPMDIYVLDNASDNEKMHRVQTQFITALYGLGMGHRAYINSADYTNRDEHTQWVVKTLTTIGKRVPLSWIFGLYEWTRKWNKKKSCENYFESNGFIYCIPWKFKQKWFGEGKRMQLGDVTVTVPQDFEAFLHMHYGDFMEYPPMHVRKPTHSIEANGIF